jgi:hypothetical protein
VPLNPVTFHRLPSPLLYEVPATASLGEAVDAFRNGLQKPAADQSAHSGVDDCTIT